jgi:NAD(P)-dependent dehydrogenase (short-subunit alcohol dehydrogenase family)
MGKLDGKVAIVTGAARGLGRAYAKRLAGLGAKVAVADLNLRSYEEFEAEAKDMTADSTVAERSRRQVAPPWGSRSMSVTTRRSRQWWRAWSRSGVVSTCWSRMQAAVVVGPWIQRPAPSIRRSYNS